MDGRSIDRNMAKDVDAGYLARVSKVEVVDLRKIDADRSHRRANKSAKRKEKFNDIHELNTIEENKMRMHR